MKLDEAEISTEPEQGAAGEGRICLPASALVGVLRQLKSFLVGLTDPQYHTSADGWMGAPIGGDVRHCLERVGALLEALETGTVSYDQCERRIEVERDRSAALARIDELIAAVGAIATYEMDRPIHVAVLLSADGSPHESVSSIGRELVFVFSQMVERHAQFRSAAEALGMPVPDRFGHSPHTTAQLDGPACAPSPLSA